MADPTTEDDVYREPVEDLYREAEKMPADPTPTTRSAQLTPGELLRLIADHHPTGTRHQQLMADVFARAADIWHPDQAMVDPATRQLVKAVVRLAREVVAAEPTPAEALDGGGR